MDELERIRARLASVPDPVALLEGIFTFAPVAFQIYRADGHCLLTNSAFRRLFGSEPPPEYNVLEDDVARAAGVLDLIRRAFQGETISTPTFWYDPRELQQVHVEEGRRVAVAATFFPLHDPEGRVSHVAIVFKDVTEEFAARELAEARLREVEAQKNLRDAILTHSGDGVIVADEQGVIRVFNPAAERQHGVAKRELAAPQWAEGYGLRDLDGAPLPLEQTPLYRALRGEKVEDARWAVRRPDGATRVLTGTASPIAHPDGSPAGAVVITRDETERLRLEAEQQKLIATLENITDFVGIASPDGTPFFVNQAALDLVGLPDLDAARRAPVADYFAPEDQPFVRDHVLPTALREGHWEGELRFRHFRTGEVIPVLYDVFAVRDRLSGAPLALATVTRDLRAQKAAEAEREQLLLREQQARRDAEAANRSKDEFLAMLGHELRNPLAPLVTALHLMRLRGGGVAERERTVIERQVAHLTALVDDLLDVSRITRGKVELSRERIEIHEVVARAIELASPLLEQRRHHLSLAVPPRGLAVEGDPRRLAQVLSNLLTNAAKYTECEGRIEVVAAREGGEVIVRVRDSGIGIVPEMLPRVFDLFVQESQAIDRSEGGLGLGLAIVKSLVALHGGSVEASSEGAGRGSTFTVRLPCAEATAAAEAAPKAPSERPAPAAPRRVLVVDDNEDAALLLAEALRDLGHVTEVAHDGPEALRVAAAFAPDVALLDIGLPVMDGYELARRLREAPGLAKVRLIAVTGYGQEGDLRAARAAGFDAHLVKPVQLARLEALIGERG